jgi:hypothetical protein
MIQTKETYLGDGLYASWDGFSVWLRAPRPDRDDHVCLEPQVLQALAQFVRSVQKTEDP